MKAKKSKWLKSVFIIVPILVMLCVFYITEVIYRHNIDQSYETLKTSREFEIQRLVKETDSFMDYTQEEELTDEQKYIVRFAISEINRGQGVHCVLLDTNYNVLEEYVDDIKEDMHLVHILKENKNLKEIIKDETDGDVKNNHFSLDIDGIPYDFYWQMIPTEHTEYYILLGTTKMDVKPNTAIETCRVFVSVINIVLAVSLYGNIYLSEHNITGEDRRKSKKK